MKALIDEVEDVLATKKISGAMKLHLLFWSEHRPHGPTTQHKEWPRLWKLGRLMRLMKH